MRTHVQQYDVTYIAGGGHIDSSMKTYIADEDTYIAATTACGLSY
jgi:hypothetical protein